MNEAWKPIPRFKGAYEVSSIGRVRSLVYKNKQCCKLRNEPRIISQHKNNGGYFSCIIRNKTYRPNRLVLEAFVGECPNGMEAAHLNGVKDDNRLENLKWVTKKENAYHRDYLHGHAPWCEGNGQSKLKKENIWEIRRLNSAGLSSKTIGEKFGIYYTYVNKILRGDLWKHLEHQPSSVQP